MTDSAPTREWLLEGLPRRNRFLLKHGWLLLAPKVRHRQWLYPLLLKAWKLRFKLYKQATPPNEEAVHERPDWPHDYDHPRGRKYAIPMRTPRHQIEDLKTWMQDRPTPSVAVAWGKAVLDQTDGRMISLLPGVGPDGIG